VARYWSIDTAATAVPLSPHPSAITKLAAAILEGGLFGGNVLPALYCPCGVELAITSLFRPLSKLIDLVIIYVHLGVA